MENILTITKKIAKRSSNPLDFLIFFGAFSLVIIIVIIIMNISEKKDEEQFRLNNKSENYQILNSILKETKKYYRLNRVKNIIIFFVAIVSCFIGLYLITFNNSLLDYIFGTITEFISATFFWIYKQCQKEEKSYYDKLFYIKKILISISLANNMKNEKKDYIYDKVIDNLMSK